MPGFLATLFKKKDTLLVAIETAPLVGFCADGEYVTVSVTNVGPRAVTVTSLMLEILGSRTLADSSKAVADVPDTPLPATLGSGEVARVSFDLRDVSNRLLALGARTRCGLYGRCTDLAGRVYRSEPWTFMPGPG
jgi:hypothetical protein